MICDSGGRQDAGADQLGEQFYRVVFFIAGGRAGGQHDGQVVLAVRIADVGNANVSRWVAQGRGLVVCGVAGVQPGMPGGPLVLVASDTRGALLVEVMGGGDVVQRHRAGAEAPVLVSDQASGLEGSQGLVAGGGGRVGGGEDVAGPF